VTDNQTKPTDPVTTIESRIRDLLESAGLQNVEDVRAAADGYCVTFTGAGKYLITDALRAAVTDAGLKIVASNGKSLVVAAPRGVTEGFQDDYARFAKGDKAIRKCDGVEFTVTDVRGDAISGVGTRTKTVKSKDGKSRQVKEPVYVELQHRKHFRKPEVKVLTPMQQAEKIVNAETSEQTIVHVDAILAMPEELITDDERRYLSSTIGWDYDKQQSADDIDDDDDPYPPDPLDLTPEERFNLTAYSDEPKPADKETGEGVHAASMSWAEAAKTARDVANRMRAEEDTRRDPEANVDYLEDLVIRLRSERDALKADLERARDINRDLARALADEKMINQARKELVEMLSQPDPAPTPAQVECEETFETPPAEYARRINAGYKVAYQQRDGGSLYVMWVREIKSSSPDDLADAVSAALKRVEMQTPASTAEDAFAAVPKNVMAKTLESITS
jgi:hypothetical protein